MGNCLFLRARGWGIDRQMKTKLQIPGGMPGGGMVTGRIEPCITHKFSDLDSFNWKNAGQKFIGESILVFKYVYSVHTFLILVVRIKMCV